MRAGPEEGPLESPETGLSDETSLAEGERPGSAPLRASPPLPRTRLYANQPAWACTGSCID